MRIISGSAKGRKLNSPGTNNRGKGIRPTSDRAREALFNILGPTATDGKHVLDLFAGTGAMGLEAMSRGALSTTFIDSGSYAIQIIKKNIELCGFSACHVFKRDLQKSLFFLKGMLPSYTDGLQSTFDLVILDPPYRQNSFESVINELNKQNLLNNNSILICEDSSSQQLPSSFSTVNQFDKRKYGDTSFWFYKQLNQDT